MPARHMNLGDRKAFAVMASYVAALQRRAPGSSDDLVSLHEAMVGVARTAAGQRAVGPPLDAFLTQAAGALHRQVEGLGQIKDVTLAREVVDRFAASLATVQCGVCANGPICDGGAGDDHRVSAATGGACVREVKSAFAFAHALTRETYADLMVGADLPDFILSTEGRTEALTAIPGFTLAVNGETRYVDVAGTRTTEINLRIAPLHLDRLSLDILPYLLLHEVFCHGLQMLRRTGERPNRQGVADPISEGALDFFCVRMLQAHAQTAPADERSDAQNVAHEAEAVHLARTSLSRHPPFPEAAAARLGRELVLELEPLLQALAPNASVLRLCLALNLHGWTYTQRFAAISRLLTEVRRRPLSGALMSLVADAAESGDAQRLANYLTTP